MTPFRHLFDTPFRHLFDTFSDTSIDIANFVYREIINNLDSSDSKRLKKEIEQSHNEIIRDNPSEETIQEDSFDRGVLDVSIRNETLKNSLNQCLICLILC